MTDQEPKISPTPKGLIIHQGNSAASGPPRLAALGADGNSSFHCVAEATNEMTICSHALCLLLNCLT